MDTPVPPELEEATELLQRAVGTAGRVIACASAAAGHNVEIIRDGASPIPIRLQPWHPDAAAEPGTVWILDKPSRRQLDELREREMNFIALNGTVRVVANGLLLDRSNLPRVRAASTLPRRVDPFSDRNSLITRILLEEPGRRWGVREIAAAAELSPGTTSQVVRTLASVGVVDFRRRGRNAEVWVANPVSLIGRWVSAYSWERNQAAAFAAPMGDPLRFVRRAERAFRSRRWALTLQGGASLVAPHASWQRLHVYMDVKSVRELFDVADAEGWPAAQDGGLVLMKPYYRHSVWHGLRMVEDLPVVSDTQLVLDLWHYPLRGMEQAEHLLTTASRRVR
ncbi:MAG TPA: helix-turn-helix domain-containing protein [Longimicrobium sp.]|nr:helix-turn-helix domain-containing protein [Longimicrobium sp.]